MDELVSLHREEYGVEPECMVSAPGVVNILGEHTDYNEGFTLQAGLNRSIKIAISKRKDNSLRFYAANTGERKRSTISNVRFKREDRWANYPKGVIHELLKAGYNLRGTEVTIWGDIPYDIGLGSSAALCIAATIACGTAYDLNIYDYKVIEIAKKAETDFMNKDIEVTDQLTSFYAKKGKAVFLDVRSLQFEYIPFPLQDKKLLLTISNVPILQTANEFTSRKKECIKCVQLLNKKKPGKSLRDYTISDLHQSVGLISENSRRLCLHVVEENRRVMEGKDALKRKAWKQLGKLLNRSHESLRDNYEVSCPELDWLVKRAWEIDGVYGSRLTGSGFGGATITLLAESALKQYYQRLEEYERIFGFSAETIFCEPAEGAKIMVAHEDIVDK